MSNLKLYKLIINGDGPDVQLSICFHKEGTDTEIGVMLGFQTDDDAEYTAQQLEHASELIYDYLRTGIIREEGKAYDAGRKA